MKREFELHFFYAKNGYHLIETRFTSSDGQTHQCIRGKSAGAVRGVGSFHWSSGVRGATALALRHLLSQETSDIAEHIAGIQRSPAASLDYALTKRPIWLSDMFGLTQEGEVFARKLFLVTNPNRKRAGPVLIRINSFALAPSDIRVFLERHRVTDTPLLLDILGNMEINEREDLPAAAWRVAQS